IAGLEEVGALLEHFNLGYGVLKRDGEGIKKGETVIEIRGDAGKILGVERLVLNILSRMSGIATLTHVFATACAPYGVKVLGTRKTTPGFRQFEKKAIALGGGLPHREGLYDEILIKDNHLALVGIENAVKKAKKKNPGKKIEVEVSSLDDATKAIEAEADIIMLDNLTAKEAKDVIDALKERGMREKVAIELSGGIDEKNIDKYATVGADYISLGCLTTNSRWLDFSTKVSPEEG
ncbi:MAG: carboxylating nicotinate-nucleotide diphosphorylase, partial [Candidatus Hydrothermarchaeales archaeon]